MKIPPTPRSPGAPARGPGRLVRPVGRAAQALAGTVRDLATQMSVWLRVFLVLIALLLAAIALLTHRSLGLEKDLSEARARMAVLAELVAAAGERGDVEQTMLPEELVGVRDELGRAVARLRTLEERSDAPARLFAEASRSVLFLQGAYGFLDAESGRPLQFLALDREGRPVSGPDGEPLVGLGGEGPPLEALMTGTAFVVSHDGLLLTNRHVALPWHYDPAARVVLAAGFLPVRHRFIGYFPGEASPAEIELVGTSQTSDLAVLRVLGKSAGPPPLELSTARPTPGDEILVLGYPAGMTALMARAPEALYAELMGDPSIDFWSMAGRLAEAGQIAPLASRGIVAQLSPTAVVYDAETTSGGSGGPVLDFDGRVTAITSAIVPDFGGSNLGVPASDALELLLAARVALWRPVAFH